MIANDLIFTTNKLYVLQGTIVSTFPFKICQELTDTVSIISFELKGKPVVAALKRDWRTADKNTIWKEQQLQSFLYKKEPKHIVPLVFPDNDCFIMGDNDIVIPVKISYYIVHDTDEQGNLKGSLNVDKAIDTVYYDMIEFYSGKNKQTENPDWKDWRNIIISDGNVLFHDFDNSV